MIQNISFTSTYKVSNQNNGYDRFSSFQDLALEKEAKSDVDVAFKDGYEAGYPFGFNNYVAQYTIAVPDSMDDEIETYCLYNGIRYRKLTNEELLNPKNIEKRIEEAQPGTTIAKINLEKLDNILPNQYSNFDHCESDYNKYYRSAVDFMLKSGEAIPAPSLSIMPDSTNTDKTVEYINRYGADALNSGQMFICLAQKTDEPEHCLWFAFRDLKMKSIPVYLDIDSYKIANALGILEE